LRMAGRFRTESITILSLNRICFRKIKLFNSNVIDYLTAYIYLIFLKQYFLIIFIKNKIITF
jgi:hypothetical protein